MIKKIFLIVLIPLFLCSCNQNREIDEQSIVSAVCFDWDKNLKITVEILSVDTDSKNIGTDIFSATGKDIKSAFSNLDKKLPKRLLFDHCAAIVLNPDMSDKRKHDILFYLIDEPTVNLSTPVIYSDNIEALLSARHESAAVGYDIMQILRHNNKEKQSRLYKTAVDFDNIISFKKSDGKVCEK